MEGQLSAHGPQVILPKNWDVLSVAIHLRLGPYYVSLK